MMTRGGTVKRGLDLLVRGLGLFPEDLCRFCSPQIIVRAFSDPLTRGETVACEPAL